MLNDVGERGVISIMMAKPYKRRKYSVNQTNNEFFFAKQRMCNVWGKLEFDKGTYHMNRNMTG